MSQSSELDFENFTEEESINYTSKVIQKLKECKQSMDFSAVEDEMLRLSYIYFDLENHMDKICKHILANDLINILHYFLWMYARSRDMCDETLKTIYVILINFSDCSEDFAKAILSSETMHSLIDDCLSEKFIDNLENQYTNEIIIKSLKVIHNIVRNLENKITYRLAEFKLRLVRFIKINDQTEVAVMSMLILSYIVEENEISLLDDGSNLIGRLLNKVKMASESPAKLYSGFTIAELMHGIRCISHNDKMKLKINEQNGIPLFLDILPHENEEGIEPILGTIWNLCFIPDIRVKLNNQYQIEKVLEPFKNHTNIKIRKNCDGILWEIKKKFDFLMKEEKKVENVQKKRRSSFCSEFDVFISYSWANKEKIVNIRNWLAQYNIRVWLDDEQMTGSLLETVASGIENSHLFVIGISSTYMKSSMCRCEAEYAYQIKKPMIPLIMELKYKPQSWLGLLMGTKVYFEFSERRNHNDEVISLVKSIKINLNSSGEIVEKKEEKKLSTLLSTSNSEMSSFEISESRLSDDVRNWTNEQVKKWLEQSQLEFLRKRFVGVDGSLLAVLFDIRAKSPEYFNKTMKSEFGLKFIEVLKFHRALNNLVLI